MDSKQLEKRKKVLLDLMNDKIYVPMKIKELAIILQVSKEERPDLELVLNELLAEGKIEISKRGKYKIAKEKTVTGTFVTHPKGFGFIEVEGRDDDIYVSEENIGNAFYGDVVQATLISGTTGKRQEGRITQVISHTVTEVVGIYEQSKHFGFVIPDNQKILQDIFIPQECAKGAVNGHKVIAEITSYGSSKKKPEGRITKIIGHISDPGTDVLSIVYAKDLPFEFPEKVLNQAERVKDEVSEADMQGRLDLRKVPMVTIDGEDAKDLDDAVSLEKDGNIWHLGVHIADVTNYVQENSALDWEAKKRGTSVYLVDRVIPMLPRRLSNGICSLNAGCDRLALSCLMDIDEKGKVIGSQIAETVICVNRRLSYTGVQKVLDGEDLRENMMQMLRSLVESDVSTALSGHGGEVNEDGLKGLANAMEGIYFAKGTLASRREQLLAMNADQLTDTVFEIAKHTYEAKEAAYTPKIMRELERVVMLRVVDEYWMDHIDAMDDLKQGIGLRAYGQHDPVIAYKEEGYQMFEAMITAIKEETIRRMFLVQLRPAQEVKREKVAKETGTSAPDKSQVKRAPVRKEHKVGPNDPCPCGSGKKYKKCCMQKDKLES